MSGKHGKKEFDDLAQYSHQAGVIKLLLNKENKIHSYGIELLIDDRRKCVVIADKEHHLSPKEYALLKLLAINSGQIVSNEDIIDHLWPYNNNADNTDVTQCVRRLRKKIEYAPKKIRWIHNVKGFGYQLATTLVD